MEQFNINKITSPRGLKKDQYDVVIIGAGIGGLVCGCYLAKAGLKVLIVEKNNKVGGYCTSFEREGFRFDACVHSLGSLGKRGILEMICKELNLDVQFVRSAITDTIITPEYKIRIMSSFQDTIEEFRQNFPHEHKNINNLFDLIYKEDFPVLYNSLKDKTFYDLLSEHIKDEYLKVILTIPLGNIGLPATMASALVSVILYREFMFKGGYYPMGGMQRFADSLANTFIGYGGDILLIRKVRKILIRNGQIQGVMTRDKDVIESRFVVSACDARETFFELIGENEISQDLKETLDKMLPSVSAFLVYLGVSYSLKDEFKRSGTIWYASTYEVDRVYKEITEGKVDESTRCLLIHSPSFHDASLAPEGKDSVILAFNAPYKSKEYWVERKKNMMDCMINRAEDVLSNLSKYINVRISATPITLQRYTMNFQGAAYGWAALPSQISRNLVPQRSEIRGLFLTGHWCTRGVGQGGVSTVVVTGKSTAQLILSRMKYLRE